MKYLLLYWLLITSAASAQRLALVTPATDASFRGLSVVDDKVAWVSGSKGYVGRSVNGGKEWNFVQVKGYEQCDFRSLYAFDAERAVIANAGSPAYILYTADGGSKWTLAYKNDDSAAFFDGISFWDRQEGIIYGDPIKGKLLLLRTHDAGKSWTPITGPVINKGEASFAASGTTIRILNNRQVVIATGGKMSRLLLSDDMGQKWRSVPAPILQGESTTGIFSVAFRSDKTAIIVGGDYKRDTLSKDHIFYTTNRGKNWIRPATPTRGYRECVEYLDDHTAIATGPTGTDISHDGGINWQPLSDETQFHTVRKSRKGNLVIMAGGKGKIAVIK